MHYPSAPPLRLSSVNVLTDLGWWAGTFHVPGRQSLVDFLAPGGHIAKLTRVHGQPPESNQARKLRVALVNLGRVTGVAEWVNQQA